MYVCYSLLVINCLLIALSILYLAQARARAMTEVLSVFWSFVCCAKA